MQKLEEEADGSGNFGKFKMKKIITYKIISYKDGSCAVLKGKRRIVSHTGKDARDKCLKATKIWTDLIESTKGSRNEN